MGYLSKIIVLSHNRTATQSTEKFLTDLGFKCAHWGGSFISIPDSETMSKDELFNKLISLTSEYDAFMDIPFNYIYEQLDKTYPGSKFILITRPSHEWVKSIRNIYASFNQSGIESYFRYLLEKYLPNPKRYIEQITDTELEYVHNCHIEDILKYFKNSNNLLHLDLYDKDKGYKIKNFIDPNLPNIEFPTVDFYISGKNKSPLI